MEKDINEIEISPDFIDDVSASALPSQQSFAKISRNKDIYRENSLPAIMNKIEVADDAFLNSILAYSVYKDNLWTISEIDKELNQITPKIIKGIKSADALYNLKIWNFNKMFFKTIDSISSKEFLQSHGEQESSYGFPVKYEYKNGQYIALDGLAHAAILISNHPNKTGNVLHLTFRGTEFSRLPAYIMSAYPDMSAYYQNFIPLEEAVMKFCRDPENKIVEIQVSGHSLGGAMVQEFLNRNPINSIDPEIRGFTFGSPGSKKNIFVKFFNIATHLVVHRKLIIEKEQQDTDVRINEFYHSNDPVPRLGLLGYNRNGVAHNLFDKAYEDAKLARLEKQSFLERIPAFGKMITYFKENVINKLQVRFHDSKRYISNIKCIIEEHYKLYPYLIPEMSKKTQYWQQYIDFENKFKSLTIRHKEDFQAFLRQHYPSLTEQQIEEKILKIREHIQFDSKASFILSRQGKENIISSETFTYFTNNKDGQTALIEEKVCVVEASIKKIKEKYSQTTEKIINTVK